MALSPVVLTHSCVSGLITFYSLIGFPDCYPCSLSHELNISPQMSGEETWLLLSNCFSGDKSEYSGPACPTATSSSRLSLSLTHRGLVTRPQASSSEPEGPGTRALLVTQKPPRARGHVHLLFLHCLRSLPHTHLIHPGSRGSPPLTAPAPHPGGALPPSPAMSPPVLQGTCSP